jgi:hypothetical protein
LSSTLTPNEYEHARRHARAILWTAVVFVAILGIVCLLCLNEWPSWLGFAWSAVFAASGLIPLIRGPRYVGILMLLDAVLLGVAAQAGRTTPAVSWSLRSASAASLFAMGLWPLLEHQCVLRKRDVLFPWGGILGIYLGCVLGFFWDALSLRVILEATIFTGALLMIQSCQHAWRILREPRQALLPRRGFPVRRGGSPLPED